jgi:hypothetical protein
MDMDFIGTERMLLASKLMTVSIPGRVNNYFAAFAGNKQTSSNVVI